MRPGVGTRTQGISGYYYLDERVPLIVALTHVKTIEGGT